jgi:hypothetical protein
MDGVDRAFISVVMHSAAALDGADPLAGMAGGQVGSSDISPDREFARIKVLVFA